MIGPGAGVAPFRAFLQERQAVDARGRNWLFFGSPASPLRLPLRRPSQSDAKIGSSHLPVARMVARRDQKVYVQDRMREAGSELWRWLAEGADSTSAATPSAWPRTSTRVARDRRRAWRAARQRRSISSPGLRSSGATRPMSIDERPRAAPAVILEASTAQHAFAMCDLACGGLRSCLSLLSTPPGGDRNGGSRCPRRPRLARADDRVASPAIADRFARIGATTRRFAASERFMWRRTTGMSSTKRLEHSTDTGWPVMRAVHLVLALDQGTTSTRSIVFDGDFGIVAMAQESFPQHYPAPGWVEHDPEDLWRTAVSTMRAAIAKAGLRAGDIAAIGVTNQRETTLVWERETGRPDLQRHCLAGPPHGAALRGIVSAERREAGQRADGIAPRSVFLRDKNHLDPGKRRRRARKSRSRGARIWDGRQLSALALDGRTSPRDRRDQRESNAPL